MKLTQILLVLISSVALLIIGVVVSSALKPNITNFDDCVDAGNPILETLPRTCKANGETFTEEQKMTISIPCEADELDCKNFVSREVAQDLFEECGGVGFDIHNLDPDENGIACEDYDYSSKK